MILIGGRNVTRLPADGQRMLRRHEARDYYLLLRTGRTGATAFADLPADGGVGRAPGALLAWRPTIDR